MDLYIMYIIEILPYLLDLVYTVGVYLVAVLWIEEAIKVPEFFCKSNVRRNTRSKYSMHACREAEFL